MSKPKIFFNCSNCGYRPPKWVGCCPECSQWGTISQLESSPFVATAKNAVATKPVLPLDKIIIKPAQRMQSGIQEWDRVLGGGLIPGAFLILTGDPGIGKSTLLLQVAHRLSDNHTVLYFSSEESLEQIHMRAARLNCISDRLLCSDQANIETILAICQEQKPDIVVIDSIQNCFSSETQVIPGSVGQLREAGFRFMRLAKEYGIAVILTGHITKEGTIAGPKMLEHMVDGVFYLQGEDRWQTRILRSAKNRFGALGELGFFEMREQGLEEVPNINQYLLNEASGSPGSALISYIEGSRPLLLELQALIVPTKFGMPQRVITGVDPKQVILMAAILEKYLHIKLSSYDIFFKVSGGFKIQESGIDLGIALALLSSYFQKPLPAKSLVLGEINLTGNIKPINHISTHIQEAHKFGIQNLIIAENQKIETSSSTVGLKRNSSVYELVSYFNEP